MKKGDKVRVTIDTDTWSDKDQSGHEPSLQGKSNIKLVFREAEIVNIGETILEIHLAGNAVSFMLSIQLKK